MKKEEAQKLIERNKELEEQLKSLCNYLMKIKRQTARHVPRLWLSAGYVSSLPLTDEAQQGPMVNQLFQLVEEARKTIRKAK